MFLWYRFRLQTVFLDFKGIWEEKKFYFLIPVNFQIPTAKNIKICVSFPSINFIKLSCSFERVKLLFNHSKTFFHANKFYFSWQKNLDPF